MTERFPKDRLVTGAYILPTYAQTESHIRDFASCGLDLIVDFFPKDRSVLDLLTRYGLGAIVSGVLPGWWGGDGENAGKLREINPPERYLDALHTFEDHPAIWGVDVGDEPSALDFPYYGEVVRLTKEFLNGPVPYLNLYPNYASVAENTDKQTVNQLGTKTYKEHIERYLEYVDLPYLSFDFYLYGLPETNGLFRMLDNLRVVSDACRRTGQDMWFIAQVNSSRKEEFTSENRLRFQAFCGLCFGASVINWGCYAPGWWFNNVLTETGEKTEQYEKLRTVNPEVKKIGDALAPYRCKQTCLLGFPDAFGSSGLPKDAPFSIKNTDGARLIVGFFEHKDDPGLKAVLILNAQDPYDRGAQAAHIRLGTVTEKTACVCSFDGSADPNFFELPPNQAILLCLK
ncbi:MAG: hypothetical protein J6023_07845 [Clostridia bacterium]|nr:hypothetical protein [Clostridia bacterium]